MEHVRFIRDLEAVPWEEDFTRVYYGEEFCDRKLPSARLVSEAYQAARDHAKLFTLVLPHITQTYLAALDLLLRELASADLSMEIIFNDWGTFDLIRRHACFTPVLGRLLNKQRRDPRLCNMADKFNTASISFFRQSNIDSRHYQHFLNKCGVSRIEFDNILIGLERDSAIAGSIYYPYGFISTTRYCQTAQCEKVQTYYNWIKTCRRECEKYEFELGHPTIPGKMFLKGNSMFFFNQVLPENLGELNINRIVYLPHL